MVYTSAVFTTMVGFMTHNVRRSRVFGATGLKRRDALYGYLFITPQMLGYFLFVLGPLVAVIVFSMQDAKSAYGPGYIRRFGQLCPNV